MAKKGTPEYLQNIVCLDFETGGLFCQDNPITEVAAIAIWGSTFEEIGRYDSLVKPYGDMEITPKALEVSNLTIDELEKKGQEIDKVVEGLIELFKQANTAGGKIYRPIIMAHNAQFDIGFLQQIFQGCSVDLSKYVAGNKDIYGNFYPACIDTLMMARMRWPIPVIDIESHKLDASCAAAGIEHFEAHRAMRDVEVTIELYKSFINSMRHGGGEGLAEATEKSRFRPTFEF